MPFHSTKETFFKKQDRAALDVKNKTLIHHFPMSHVFFRFRLLKQSYREDILYCKLVLTSIALHLSLNFGAEMLQIDRDVPELFRCHLPGHINGLFLSFVVSVYGLKPVHALKIQHMLWKIKARAV